MFSKITLTILFYAFASTVFAQSGRIKPVETPTPNAPRPSVVYLPTQTNSQLPKPKTAPTPTPKIIVDEDEVISVESALVPIPASVVDSSGRAVTNLKLEDFELLIDGKAAVIGDLF